MVGLEPHLAAKRGRHLALLAAHTGECLPAELGLDEELGIEDLRGRIEGRARDRGVHPVGSCDRVGGEQPDDLEVLEADVEEAGEYGVDAVWILPSAIETNQGSIAGHTEGLWNKTVISRLGSILAAEQELELRCSGALSEPDGTRELNAVIVEYVSTCKKGAENTHKSAAEMLCLAMNGFCNATISSVPSFAWKFVSMSENRTMEPSAPPPTNSPRAWAAGEKATASWKVRRRDSWASSAHWLWKRFSTMSSLIGKRAQHAAFVAVFLPSGQATRRVSAAVERVTAGHRGISRERAYRRRLEGQQQRRRWRGEL